MKVFIVIDDDAIISTDAVKGVFLIFKDAKDFIMECSHRSFIIQEKDAIE